VRTIALYAESAQASVDEVVGNLAKGLTAKTRVVAVTWVHSSTGVRLPIAEMSRAIADANKGRDEKDRILFCVDGVHGLGIVDTMLPALGCDFFVAGTHKWVLGPRGTGVWWGRADAWPHVQPTIPPFGAHDQPGTLHSPGGFHSYEHRWALNEAFRFHLALGKPRVQDRILDLNQRIRDGLAGMPHISLATPRSRGLSAGINCFDVRGMNPGDAVHRLAQRNIVASESPYARSYVRLAGSLLVNESQVDEALEAVRTLA
jgi:selenocysteine lyase/cysteine desulfurase